MAKSKSTDKGSADKGAADNDTQDVHQLDFESALAALEGIVGQLELGQVGLTESLEQYESGIKHLKRCYKLLDQAEKRVEILSGTDSDGTPQTEHFEDSNPESLAEKADSRSQRRSASAKTTSPPSAASKSAASKPARAKPPKPKSSSLKPRRPAKSTPPDDVDVPRGLF